MQTGYQFRNDIFDFLDLCIFKADNVRFAVAVAIFHDYDVANNLLTMLVCALEERANRIYRKVPQSAFLVDDHAKWRYETHRVNVLDIAINGRANGFVERVVEILNADLTVCGHDNAFHCALPPKSIGSSGSHGSTVRVMRSWQNLLKLPPGAAMQLFRKTSSV